MTAQGESDLKDPCRDQGGELGVTAQGDSI